MKLYKLNAKNKNTNLYRGLYILFVRNKKIGIWISIYFITTIANLKDGIMRQDFCYVSCMVFHLYFGPLNLIRLISPCITF
jgi:hypothetical protein